MPGDFPWCTVFLYPPLPLHLYTFISHQCLLLTWQLLSHSFVLLSLLPPVALCRYFSLQSCRAWICDCKPLTASMSLLNIHCYNHYYHYNYISLSGICIAALAMGVFSCHCCQLLTHGGMWSLCDYYYLYIYIWRVPWTSVMTWNSQHHLKDGSSNCWSWCHHNKVDSINKVMTEFARI